MAASRDKKVKQTAGLFIITFLISLIVFTYFIKSFSPNVDVEIGGEESRTVDSETTDSDVKQAIDDRLRWIQMEDNMPGASKRDDAELSENQDENSEHVRKNEAEKQTEQQKIKDKNLEPIELNGHSKMNMQPPTPAAPVAEPPKMSKVYVGSYATIDQAIQAQNKLMNTSVSVSPFVKEVNGSYVLQVGSYANASKAEAVSREISSLGFSVRVVKE